MQGDGRTGESVEKRSKVLFRLRHVGDDVPRIFNRFCHVSGEL